MRGIILTSGTGADLGPLTLTVCPPLLAVYDKPMIYYPLSTLIEAGIRDFLIIAAAEDVPHVQRSLGNGDQFGIRIEYAAHGAPGDIDQALALAEDFIDGGPVALVCSDGIFHGSDLVKLIASHTTDPKGLRVVTHRVAGPAWRGHAGGEPRAGLYLYDKQVSGIARSFIPSQRATPGVSRVNDHYMRAGQLNTTLLWGGTVWMDIETPTDLANASWYVSTVEQRQGLKIGCVEESAWRAGFISDAQLAELARPLLKSGYGNYLMDLMDGGFGHAQPSNP